MISTARPLRHELMRPFHYLDEVIERLEELHMRRRKYVPAGFDERLEELDDMLPDSIQPPRRWAPLVRDAIDQCFELQERLLRLRDAAYAEQLDLEELEGADPAA
jgi:hypothetical protein